MKKVFMSIAVVAMIALASACGNNSKKAAEESCECCEECTECCDSCTACCDSCAACDSCVAE